jgi:sulfur carrier protein
LNVDGKGWNRAGEEMKITVNGEEKEVTGATTIVDLLEVLKVKMPDMVSVEYNSEILDRKRFVDTRIKEGDHVEFLYFMGGGAAGVLV